MECGKQGQGQFVDVLLSVLAPVIGITIQPVSLDTGFVVTVVGIRLHFGLSPLLASFFLTVRCRTVDVVFDAWVWLERAAAAGANFDAQRVNQ
jgi:hypothetical protein